MDDDRETDVDETIPFEPVTSVVNELAIGLVIVASDAVTLEVIWALVNVVVDGTQTTVETLPLMVVTAVDEQFLDQVEVDV